MKKLAGLFLFTVTTLLLCLTAPFWATISAWVGLWSTYWETVWEDYL